MKKFKVRVERVDEYEIEFDENVINKEFMEDFKKYFYNFDTLEEHAEHIAQFRARFRDSLKDMEMLWLMVSCLLW